MSVQSMSFWDCVDITLEIKKHISCPIIWGGIQPMIDAERCLDYSDIIIRGEAEYAMVNLFERLRKKKPYTDLKNLWIKTKNGKLHKNECGDLIQNLDELPYPDFTDKNKTYIINGKILMKNPAPHYKYEYNITSSRGCPMNCTFCFEHVLNKEFKFKYLRRRSVDNVIGELKLAIQLYPKIKKINFWDNIFTMDKLWIKEFSEKYGKEIGLPFFCYSHSLLIKDPDMIKWLYAAGMNDIFFGMQTGSEKLRKQVYNRPESNTDVVVAAKIVRKYAPRCELRFDMIMSGFEKPDILREGVNFLLTLPKPFGINKNFMAYYLNFEITKKALAKGIISSEDIASVNRNIRTQVATKKNVLLNPFITYYYLVGRRYVPNFLIKLFLITKFETKHPKLFCKLFEFFDWFETKSQEIYRIKYLLRNKEFKYLLKKIFLRAKT